MAAGSRPAIADWPRKRQGLFAAAALVVQAAIACAVMWLVSTSGTYPGGGDTYAHLFEAQSVLDGLKSGVAWPLVEPLWYNGAQATRYAGPFFTYALAGCEALAGGALGGFVAFCGLVYLIGALSWLRVGRLTERPWLSLVLGALWFFLPANLAALFQMGNLPGTLCLALLPALLGEFAATAEGAGRGHVAAIAALSAATVLSNPGFAVVEGLGLLLYALCLGLARRKWAGSARALLAVCAGAALCGVWLVPYVVGGGMADVALAQVQGLLSTCSPLGWLQGADAGIYLGVAAAALVIFGLACGRAESRPAFLAALIAVVLTAAAVQPVVRTFTCFAREGSLGLVSVALALAFYAVARWRSLRRPLLVAVLVLLAIDAAPSWQLAYGNHNGASAEKRLERDAESTLIDQACDITVQRLALVDEAGLDAESAYLATSRGVAIAEGSDGRMASAANYEQLDRALEEGRFGYLFDRSLELGCDSVLVRTSLVQEQGPTLASRIDSAAGQSGYELVDESGEYRLYHRSVEGMFGIKSAYEAIAIGTGAGQIALQFPSVEETTSTDLNDYSFDELSDYKTVYLDGFTYSDKATAEQLVRDLAAAGTRVVIMADGMPGEERTGSTTFLGVSDQDITFHNGFPELQTNIGALACQLFPSGHEQWQTVYLNGLDEVWGFIDEDGRELDFFGSVCDGNVVFVGLNLTYFEAVTGDAGVAALLAQALDLDPAELPERELVPLEVSIEGNEVRIEAQDDDVCTALAWQDTFEGAGAAGASCRNGLVYVNAGTTALRMGYPNLAAGLCMSGAGLLGAAALTRRGAHKDPENH